jgi:two-component system cell cycle response regulator
MVINPATRPRQLLVAKAAREAQAGRRLAIYDRETGLLAYWYFEQRLDEEIKRAVRYERSLTVLFAEVPPGEFFRNQDQVVLWLKKNLRSSDLATHLGDGRFLVLLTETSFKGGIRLASRLRLEFPELQVGIAMCPAEGTTVTELQAAATGHFVDEAPLNVKPTKPRGRARTAK